MKLTTKLLAIVIIIAAKLSPTTLRLDWKLIKVNSNLIWLRFQNWKLRQKNLYLKTRIELMKLGYK